MSFGDFAITILCHLVSLLKTWPFVTLIIGVVFMRDLLDILNRKLAQKEIKLRQILSCKRKNKECKQ